MENAVLATWWRRCFEIRLMRAYWTIHYFNSSTVVSTKIVPLPEETVNLAGLFSCQGAVCDANSSSTDNTTPFATQLSNAELVAELAKACGWKPQMPHPSLRSGILLLEACDEPTRSLTAEKLRGLFHERGVSLTCYDQGRVRLSMPGDRLNQEELQTLRLALAEVA